MREEKRTRCFIHDGTYAQPNHLEVGCKFLITDFMTHMEKLLEPCRSGHRLNLLILEVPLLIAEAIIMLILNLYVVHDHANSRHLAFI
jgi:hypothetical protein